VNGQPLQRKLALAARALKHTASGQRLRHLTIEVTKRCNARCEFCDYWREPRGEELADYAPIVRRFDPLVVTISGGEPLLRPDLDEVIRRIRAADPPVYLALVTNGALLTAERAVRLRDAGLDQLSISYDYPDERHDRARGIPGLEAKIRGQLPALAAVGFDTVSLNTVLKNDNLDDVPAILELALRSGARVGFSAYCALKTGDERLLVAGENREKLRAAIARIKEAKARHRITRTSEYYLDRVEEYFAGRAIPGCQAGISWIQVTPAGAIKPCSELPIVAADYRDYEPRAAQEVSCASCWYSCRGESQAPLDLRRLRDLW
jgi:MoaA/NifB/PqqE/SkfB family radical SAM enzyme